MPKVAGRSEMRSALHMRLEREQWVKLDAMSDALGLTRTEVVRRLIDEARYSPVVIDVELKGQANGVAEKV